MVDKIRHRALPIEINTMVMQAQVIISIHHNLKTLTNTVKCHIEEKEEDQTNREKGTRKVILTQDRLILAVIMMMVS